MDYETELVVRINRLGKNIAPRFASRYYDAVTVGIAFTARDLQRQFQMCIRDRYYETWKRVKMPPVSPKALVSTSGIRRRVANQSSGIGISVSYTHLDVYKRQGIDCAY